MFKKNKGKLRLQDLFSNAIMQLSLEKLDWIHQERNSRAWEFITFVEIEKESKFFAVMLRSLDKPIQLGDYKYYLAGSNRIERQSPKINSLSISAYCFLSCHSSSSITNSFPDSNGTVCHLHQSTFLYCLI